MRPLVPAILLLVLLGLALPLAFPVRGEILVPLIQGPAALAPGAVAPYNVTVSGGAAGDEYTYTWYLKGANLTGGAPTQSSPGRVAGNQTQVQFNVTAPKAQGTVTIYLTVSSKSTSGATSNATATFDFTVLQPIVLSATFHNDSATTAVNVTVRFYVDGAFVGTAVLKKIAPNADATASYNYLPVNLAAGQHTVRVEADLGGSQSVTYTLFYKDVPPPNTSLAVLLGIGAFIPAFLATVALRRRKA